MKLLFNISLAAIIFYLGSISNLAHQCKPDRYKQPYLDLVAKIDTNTIHIK